MDSLVGLSRTDDAGGQEPPVLDRKATILVVDDEPAMLSGLVRLLRRRFDVVTAGSASEALQIVFQREHRFSVIMTDYAMPDINGVTLLREMRTLDPAAVRVLLTGQADLEAAIDAVNEGSVFRYIRKSAPTAKLIDALDAARIQHELIVAEQVLLERTLHGSIAALVDILAMFNPAAFGRAGRVKRLVGEMARSLEITDQWAIEVAAMLSQIGTIALPPSLVDKLATAEALSEGEAEAAAEIPHVAARVIAKIPRLESVRGILEAVGRPVTEHGLPCRQPVPPGAKLLTLALDFDDLTIMNLSAEEALRRMRARTGRYDPVYFDCLVARFSEPDGLTVSEIRLPDVVPGMVFIEDVRTTDGKLLISRGQEATEGLVARIHNYWTALPIAGTICVTRPGAQRTAVASEGG